MKLDSMKDLYVSVLQDAHDGEMQMIKALPKLARGATSPELAKAFQSHLEETKEQAKRLEQILADLGEKPGANPCEAMEGLVAEGDEMLKAKGDAATRDAGLIVAAQKVEHYEIAGYGSLCTFARLLGREFDETLLEQCLEEEKHADEALTALAEGEINAEASTASADTKRSGTGRRKSAT